MTGAQDRTRRLLDQVVRRMLELDARNGLEAIHQGTQPGGADTAAAIGNAVLKDIADAFGLDAEQLLAFAQGHGALQADAMLAALGMRLDDTGHELMLMRGATSGGVLTGLRVGLLLADALDREKAA